MSKLSETQRDMRPRDNTVSDDRMRNIVERASSPTPGGDMSERNVLENTLREIRNDIANMQHDWLIDGGRDAEDIEFLTDTVRKIDQALGDTDRPKVWPKRGET